MNKFGRFLIFLTFIILCAVVLFIINPLKKMNEYNDMKRVNDLLIISQALEKYHSDYGSYPASIPWGGVWEPYISRLPKDPSSDRKYVYVSTITDNYQSYRLYASLQDPAAQKRACSVFHECPNVPAGNLCRAADLSSGSGQVASRKAPCNFGVTSSNVSP